MKLYQFTTEDLENQCNNIRRILIDKLFKKGLISEETYQEFMINYAFIVRKPSLFNSFWNQLLKQKDETSYILVKQESFLDDLDEETREKYDEKKKKNFKVIDLDKHKKE